MVGALSAAGSTDDSGDSADRVTLMPYVTSTRADREPSQRRLPIPAAAAIRLWSRNSVPTVDRWLGRPDLVHGTNYVVPPTRCPRVVSVYDCWFLEHPRDVDADVRRAAAVLRRSVLDGAHVVTSSTATTSRVRELLATDRVHTIHLGPPPVPTIPPEDRPVSLPDLDDGPFILALGTIERRKNIPTLVAAFGRLAREHEHVRLVIAGAPGNDAAGGRPRRQPPRPRGRPPRHPSRARHRCREDVAARQRPDPGLPIARRGVRLSDPGSTAAGHPGRREHRRIDPRDHGGGGVAERSPRLRGPRRQPLLGRQQRRHARQARTAWSRQPAPLHLVDHR